MSFAPGTRLGPYEVLAPLGSGGMGEVYKGRDTRLDRTVAVKVLSSAMSTDPEFKARFEREARAISALNHPHICVLYDIGIESGVDYLVLEYLEGETLAERLRHEPRGLKLAEVLGIAIAIADALDAAHRRGIVHRDLKPGNVMLTPGGPKLLDFGLAKEPAGMNAAGLTMLATRPGTGTGQGIIVGTLQYMAPEQIQGLGVDGRTDIFALGAVLYEMVTGRKAFEAQTQASLIAKILEVDPPAPSTLAPVCAPAVDRLVQRCLAKAPDDRWQVARDVLLETRWIRDHPAMEPGRAQPATVWRMWLPWAVTALAAFVALAAWAQRPARVTTWPPVARFDIPLAPGMSPLTDWQGGPALSPDGRHVAVATALEGRLKLLVRRIDGTSYDPLPGTDGARSPFWSPDSRSIAFFDGTKVKRVDLAGGPTATLADAEGAAYGGSWGAGGNIIFAMDGAIRRIPPSGGQPEPVTVLDRSAGQSDHRYPHFLPDGRTFLFTVFGRGAAIHVGSLDGGATKLLLADGEQPVFVPPSTLLFVRQESVLAVAFDPRQVAVTGHEQVVIDQVVPAVSANAKGTVVFRPPGRLVTELQWLGRDGRRLGAAGAPGPYQAMALSPSGRRVALQRGNTAAVTLGAVDIWVLEFATGVLARVTTDSGFEGDPAWSPDERSLAFTVRRDGPLQIYRKDLTTDAEGPFGKDPQVGNLDEWTPDGRFVIYRRAGRLIHALPSSGDQSPRLVADTPRSIEDQVHVSPDGRWMAFNSTESGRWEIYVATFPDFTSKRQVSSDGGVQPLWRHDGRELFYLDARGRMMAIDVAPGAAAEFGVPRALFGTALNPSPHLTEYGVSPDGNRFLVLEPVGGAAPGLGFLLNWRLTGTD